MDNIEMKAWTREKIGKGAAKKLRRAGLLPGILYSRGYSKPITLNSKDFFKNIKNKGWSTTIFTLCLNEEDKKKDFNVMVKDYQIDPVFDGLLHVDLYEVTMDRPITLKVPIVLKGQAPGVENGGILVHILGELEIECLPSIIPHTIEADISNLDVGDSIHVANLQLDPRIRILPNPEEPIVSISPPSAIEVAPKLPTSPPEQPPEE